MASEIRYSRDIKLRDLGQLDFMTGIAADAKYGLKHQTMALQQLHNQDKNNKLTAEENIG